MIQILSYFQEIYGQFEKEGNMQGDRKNQREDEMH
jgi:hypothetical protein